MSDRSSLIRLASILQKGDEGRRAILSSLNRLEYQVTRPLYLNNPSGDDDWIAALRPGGRLDLEVPVGTKVTVSGSHYGSVIYSAWIRGGGLQTFRLERGASDALQLLPSR